MTKEKRSALNEIAYILTNKKALHPFMEMLNMSKLTQVELSNILANHINWNITQEGYDFWYKLDRQIKEILREQPYMFVDIEEIIEFFNFYLSDKEQFIKENVLTQFKSFLNERDILDSYCIHLKDSKKTSVTVHDLISSFFLWKSTKEGTRKWIDWAEEWRDIVSYQFGEYKNTEIYKEELLNYLPNGETITLKDVENFVITYTKDGKIYKIDRHSINKSWQITIEPKN